jgi:Flp pilus assembly protein TadD
MNVVDAAIAGGDPAMALKVSQSVLATSPHNLDALYHEGAAYYAMNRCMDAIAVYKVALTVDPKSAEADVGVGRCLLRRDAVTAEQMFEAAVANDPDNAGAQAAYQQALLLQPGSVSTEVNLGMSLALAGDGPDALQYLGPLATSQDATPKIREDYAAALVAAGRPDQARAVLAIDLPETGVQQLMADFSLAISQPAPAPAAAPPAAAPAVTAPAAPAPIQAQPLAEQTVAPIPATPVVAPAPVAQAAPTPAAPPAPAAPPVVVSTAAPPAAMLPSALPAASLAAPENQGLPPVTASDATQQAKNAAAYDLLMR